MISIGAVALLATAGQSMVIPVLPLYLKENLGFNAGLIGLIFGAYAASETLVKTPFGFVSDRLGRRFAITAGLLFCLPVPYLMTLLHHPVSFTMIQVLNGAGVAAFWPALAALTADLVAPENRAQAMTVFNMSYLTAFGLAPALGTFANHASGTNTTAFYLATVILAFAVLTAFITLPGSPRKKTTVRSLKSQNPEKSGSSRAVADNPLSDVSKNNTVKARRRFTFRKADLLKNVSELISQPILAAMLFISLIQQFGIGLLVPVFVLYCREQVGFTQAEIGQIFLFPVIIIAVLAIPLGRAADHVGKPRAVRYAYLAAALVIFLMPVTKRLIAWQALVAVLEVAYVLGTPAWTALSSIVAPGGRRGAAIAAIGTMQSLGFAISPGVGGLLYDSVAPAAPFFICAAFLMICLVLFSLLVSEKRIAALSGTN
ncbi:MAG: MFS transporter [Bacillota bacterium]